MTELAAHEEALLANGGYQRPGPEYDEGTQIVGRRIWVDGHGPGLCCEFQRAMVGVSSHLVRLDESGANVELKLERKGNRQLRWLIGPAAVTQPRAGVETVGGSDVTLALLHTTPPPLASIVSDVTGQWLCHYCCVDGTVEVAELLLRQLVVSCSAASRLLSAATPAAVRVELEVALLADRAGASTPREPGEESAVVQAVLRICEQFAKSKASFGGRFTSKETRSKAVETNTELAASCELVWPWEDRLALARWLYWAYDPPVSGNVRHASCWRGFADADALATHQTQCKMCPTQCPHHEYGCQALLNLTDVESHARDCEYKPVPCVLGCGQLVPRNAMEAHTNGGCGERVVACAWCDLGCAARVKQALLPTHEAEASAEHLALAREAILAQQMLTADLAARNAELRSHAELSAEALASLRAHQSASEQRLLHQFAEINRGERASAQESNAALQSAGKTIKTLEKEVKGLRKEVGALSGMKQELRELQRSMAEMRQQAEAPK